MKKIIGNVRGMRDLLDNESRKKQKLEAIARELAGTYGFQESSGRMMPFGTSQTELLLIWLWRAVASVRGKMYGSLAMLVPTWNALTMPVLLLFLNATKFMTMKNLLNFHPI